MASRSEEKKREKVFHFPVNASPFFFFFLFSFVSSFVRFDGLGRVDRMTGHYATDQPALCCPAFQSARQQETIIDIF
jgi:hypothetical protein